MNNQLELDIRKYIEDHNIVFSDETPNFYRSHIKKNRDKDILIQDLVESNIDESKSIEADK